MSPMEMPKHSSQVPKSQEGFDNDFVSPAVTENEDSIEYQSKQARPPVFARDTTQPLLTTPLSSKESIVGAFRAWIEAARAFREQLKASDQVNLDVRQKFSMLAVSQAKEMISIIAAKEVAIKELSDEIKQKQEEFNQMIQQMETYETLQQKEIDKINQNTKKDKEEYAKALNDYQTCLSELRELGVIELENGEFSFSSDDPQMMAKFDEILNDYRQATTRYNQYLDKRSGQFDSYNETSIAYNQKVAEYNHAIQHFIDTYHLSDSFKKNNIQIPQLAPTSLSDISNLFDEIALPTVIEGKLSLFPPKTPPSPLQNLPSFPTIDSQLLNTLISSEISLISYEEKIASYDQRILLLNHYLAFISKEKGEIDEDLKEPILNDKRLATQLLDSSKSTPSTIQTNSFSLTMEGLKIGEGNSEAILGYLLFKEIIAEAHIEAIDQLDDEKKNEKATQIANQLLLLSIGSLANQGMQALFPSIGIIADHLASIPKDSPLFPLLFSVSFFNRISENIEQGISSMVVDQFITSNPEFSGISSTDLTKLKNAFNVGQLLVASKMLEESLGLQGLFESLLPHLSPKALQLVLIKVNEEDLQEKMKIKTSIRESFIEKGFPEDKALYFAQMGIKLLEHGVLAPNLAMNISEKSVDRSMLIDSLTTELAFSPDYSLERARMIAEKGIKLTLEEGPYLSSLDFRFKLASHLNALEVQHYSNIVKGVIIAPLPLSAEKIHFSSLSLKEIDALIYKQTFQLLPLEMTTSLKEEIGQEVVKSLTGSTPYSFINVMKDQLHSLSNGQEKEWISALHDTFIERMKTMTSFAAFAKKLQDPAYQYVIALNLIHGGEYRRKHPIDVVI